MLLNWKYVPNTKGFCADGKLHSYWLGSHKGFITLYRRRLVVKRYTERCGAYSTIPQAVNAADKLEKVV